MQKNEAREIPGPFASIDSATNKSAGVRPTTPECTVGLVSEDLQIITPLHASRTRQQELV
jgi:hypothetical protein